MLENKVVLVGYSGHAYVVAEAAIEQGLNLKYYTEKQAVDYNPFKLDYLGFESDDNFLEWNKNYSFALGIGNNFVREKIGKIVLDKTVNLINIIHPKSSISKMIEIGKGNFISKSVCINPLVSIGNFCIINTGSIVEHECRINNGVHIAPGAVLAGNVEVGENTFIGANCVIKQGVKIGKNVIVGAGSVVIKNIEDNSVYVGNPAKKIK